jgi:hypothetical protein
LWVDGDGDDDETLRGVKRLKRTVEVVRQVGRDSGAWDLFLEP